MKSLIKNSSRPILLILLFLGAQLNGATSRSEVKLLEASEDIKLISQQVVKDYFYLSQNRKEEVEAKLQKGVLALDEKLRLIAAATKSDDTKNILTFLAFSRDQMSETIALPYDTENGALMLDYSETLLEGAESIANEHVYQFSEEEQMLINVKKMAYLIERITKYYMAFQVGFNDHNNVKQLQSAIASFNKELVKLNAYEYRGESAEDLATINHYWPIAKKFYLTLEKRELPNILYISAGHLESVIGKLELYHSKNQ
ncbi:MAG: hypothetical protein ABFR02_03245 [Campylobacterota bacterium]